MFAEAPELVSKSVLLPISEQQIKNLPNEFSGAPESVEDFIIQSHYADLVQCLQSGFPVKIEPYQNVGPVNTRGFVDFTGLPDVVVTYAAEGVHQYEPITWYVGYGETRDALFSMLVDDQDRPRFEGALHNFQAITLAPQR